MRQLRRIILGVLLAVASNVVWIAYAAVALPIRVAAVVAAVAFWVAVVVWPRLTRDANTEPELRRFGNGYESLLLAGVAMLADVVYWVWLGLHIDASSCGSACPAPVWLLYGVDICAALFVLFTCVVVGFVRVGSAWRRVPAGTMAFMALLWWFPPATAFLLGRGYKTALAEYEVERAKEKRDAARAAQRVCATRYPLLLVHGIFFRDWEAFGYWGRIPAALERNGARVYYGQQQSSMSVPDSGAEVAAAIRRVLAETGADKVNIIAHSKGGLDSRWAISNCAMAPHVASLTTINTPHRGCNFARVLLERIPSAATNAIGDSYDALFSKLGDEDPDFLAGVVDLTDTECAKLNAQMPDVPGVLYQSVGSKMAGRFAALFPLNLGYSIIEPMDGDNDGLVAVSSMAWGECLPLIQPAGSQGISHADMVDMLRKDVPGFDVCEYYVQLVASLKARGL
ncbi:MAG: hypothetical protein LBR58_06495 [Propionibacteriaceae bacterium]|jgi:triacylglycerol lipase|nr:hypothetical protein [Propionibacteriaceae bacterium]